MGNSGKADKIVKYEIMNDIALVIVFLLFKTNY